MIVRSIHFAVALFASWIALGIVGPAPAREPAAHQYAASAFHFAPSRPGVREAYIVSFGLFGDQSVFESEARGAAAILSQRLAHAQSAVRFNTKQGGTATPLTLAAALKAAGRVMDPSNDVLVPAADAAHDVPRSPSGFVLAGLLLEALRADHAAILALASP